MNMINSVWTVINNSATNILILCLTVLTIFELLDIYGINVKLFSYSKRKKEKEARQIRQAVDEYINDNKNLFKGNSQEYINYILASMGIKRGQLDRIFSSLDDLKKENAVIKTQENMGLAIKELLQDKRIVIDLSKVDPKRTVIYSGLRYYINLTDTFNIISIKKRVMSILYFHIENELSKQNLSLRDIDRLLIPTESNVILGMELAELLDIVPVIMHNKKRRIYDDQYWDGDLSGNLRLIVVHDVIFSADNILDCIHRIPRSCRVVGVFALINRTDMNQRLPGKSGKALIETAGVKVFAAMDVNDVGLDELNNNERGGVE